MALAFAYRFDAPDRSMLSHLVPAEDPAVSDEMWIEAARRHFHGRVILGRDLLEV